MLRGMQRLFLLIVLAVSLDVLQADLPGQLNTLKGRLEGLKVKLGELRGALQDLKLKLEEEKGESENIKNIFEKIALVDLLKDMASRGNMVMDIDNQQGFLNNNINDIENAVGLLTEENQKKLKKNLEHAFIKNNFKDNNWYKKVISSINELPSGGGVNPVVVDVDGTAPSQAKFKEALIKIINIDQDPEVKAPMLSGLKKNKKIERIKQIIAPYAKHHKELLEAVIELNQEESDAGGSLLDDLKDVLQDEDLDLNCENEDWFKIVKDQKIPESVVVVVNPVVKLVPDKAIHVGPPVPPPAPVLPVQQSKPSKPVSSLSFPEQIALRVQKKFMGIEPSPYKEEFHKEFDKVFNAQNQQLFLTEFKEAFQSSSDSKFRKKIFDEHLTPDSIYTRVDKISFNDAIKSKYGEEALRDVLALIQGLESKFFGASMTEIQQWTLYFGKNSKDYKTCEAALSTLENDERNALIHDNLYRKYVRKEFSDHFNQEELNEKAQEIKKSLEKMKNDGIYPEEAPSAELHTWVEYINSFANWEQINTFYDHIKSHDSWKAVYTQVEQDFKKVISNHKAEAEAIAVIDLSNEAELKILRHFPDVLSNRLSKLSDEDLEAVRNKSILSSTEAFAKEILLREQAEKLVQALSFADINSISTIINQNLNLIDCIKQHPVLFGLLSTLNPTDLATGEAYRKVFLLSRQKEAEQQNFVMPKIVPLFVGKTPNERFVEAMKSIMSFTGKKFEIKNNAQAQMNSQGLFIAKMNEEELKKLLQDSSINLTELNKCINDGITENTFKVTYPNLYKVIKQLITSLGAAG